MGDSAKDKFAAYCKQWNSDNKEKKIFNGIECSEPCKNHIVLGKAVCWRQSAKDNTWESEVPKAPQTAPKTPPAKEAAPASITANESATKKAAELEKGVSANKLKEVREEALDAAAKLVETAAKSAAEKKAKEESVLTTLTTGVLNASHRITDLGTGRNGVLGTTFRGLGTALWAVPTSLGAVSKTVGVDNSLTQTLDKFNNEDANKLKYKAFTDNLDTYLNTFIEKRKIFKVFYENKEVPIFKDDFLSSANTAKFSKFKELFPSFQSTAPGGIIAKLEELRGAVNKEYTPPGKPTLFITMKPDDFELKIGATAAKLNKLDLESANECVLKLEDEYTQLMNNKQEEINNEKKLKKDAEEATENEKRNALRLAVDAELQRNEIETHEKSIRATILKSFTDAIITPDNLDSIDVTYINKLTKDEIKKFKEQTSSKFKDIYRLEKFDEDDEEIKMRNLMTIMEKLESYSGGKIYKRHSLKYIKRRISARKNNNTHSRMVRREWY